jgi:uncharacterized surface protein with fasciclin (FAS1) repeats
MKRRIFLLLMMLTFFGLSLAQNSEQIVEENMAMLRFAHLSHNAPAVDVLLFNKDNEAIDLPADALTSIAYKDVTTYMMVPDGNYDVTVSISGETTVVVTKEMTLDGNNFYTLSALGLVLPAEDVQPSDDDGGFFDWLGNLFSNDDGSQRDALALRLELVKDDLYRDVALGNALIRVVHASPGSPDVDVAELGEDSNLFDNLSFPGFGDYRELEAGATVLSIRVADSQISVYEVTDLDLDANTLNTIYVIGTTLETSPIEVLVLSDQLINQQAEDNRMLLMQTDGSLPMDGSETILDVLASDRRFRTLAIALGSAGLGQMLDDQGNYTVFAPTNDAFATIPAATLEQLLKNPDTMAAILSYHALNERLSAVDISERQSLDSVQGEQLGVTIANDMVTINQARVTTANIETSNGVIHIIDALLVPPSVFEAVNE